VAGLFRIFVAPGPPDSALYEGNQGAVGLQHIPQTCVLEVDALNSPKAREFAQKLWIALQSAEIPRGTQSVQECLGLLGGI
jgi:hypothetical protein